MFLSTKYIQIFFLENKFILFSTLAAIIVSTHCKLIHLHDFNNKQFIIVIHVWGGTNTYTCSMDIKCLN